MSNTAPDRAYAEELLQRQELLQAEARQVIAELDLVNRLARAGEVQQCGSSLSGLMVWRDLDFIVAALHRSPAEVFEVMRPLLIHPRLRRLDYRNETGDFNSAGPPANDRYYFVLYYQSEAGAEWKIDLSFWVNELPRGPQADLQRLAQRLTPETRLAILWIKDVWHRLPVYPYRVGGTDVYDAVHEHGVRAPDQFDAYLRERGLPTRE
jgi:hypothetical protein